MGDGGTLLEKDEMQIQPAVEPPLVLTAVFSRKTFVDVTWGQSYEFKRECDRGSMDAVERLLRLPLDPNEIEHREKEYTSLQSAVQRGNLTLAQCLLEARADPDKTEGRERAVSLAAQGCHVEMVKALVHARAHVETTIFDALLVSNRDESSREQVVKLLLDARALPYCESYPTKYDDVPVSTFEMAEKHPTILGMLHKAMTLEEQLTLRLRLSLDKHRRNFCSEDGRD